MPLERRLKESLKEIDDLKTARDEKAVAESAGHKRQEAALLGSEQRFRELAENINEVFWVTDPTQSEVLYVSPAYEKTWGRTCESLYRAPNTWFAAVYPPDLARVQQAVFDQRTTGSYDEEYRIVRTDNSIRWIRDRAFPVRTPDGVVCRIVGVAEDITARKQAELELRAAEQSLRGLVGRLHTVREEEAKRIARELHDDLGQALTALNMELADLQAKLPGATVKQREQITRMHAIVDHTIVAVQHIASDLRLGQLDVLGLTAAIEWQLQEFSRQSSIPCHVLRLDEVENLSDAERTTIFRILQEALTNIARHAGATEVKVSLEAGATQMVLQVTDNGRGITNAQMNAENAIGLLGMRERAQLIGADITVWGNDDAGTTVRVRVPLNRTRATP